MGGYEYSIELIKYLERTHCQNQLLFGKKHTTAERTSQTMADCKFSCQKNTVPFKEWMTVILSVTRTDTLLQGMSDCN